MKVLTRSPAAIYAAAGEGGETHAVGVMSFGARWAGIHGMRTAPAHRGRGHASAILAAMGRVAQARGMARVLLQVEEANPARRIYRAAGRSPKYRTAGAGLLKIIGWFNPLFRELPEMLYLQETPVLLDDSKLARKLGELRKTRLHEPDVARQR